MKKLLSILLLLAAGQAHAWRASFEVQCTVATPCPSAFDKANSQSLVLSSLEQPIRELCVTNATGTRVMMNTINWNAATPSTVTQRIEPFSWICIYDQISSSVYIAGETGAITDNGYIHGFAN